MGYFGGSPLIMFFYGTLKRGERNHEHFCGGALRVKEGTVRGDLFDVHLGYPALVVPEESICAFGTGDYRRDAEEQQRLGHGQARYQSLDIAVDAERAGDIIRGAEW